MVNFTDQDLIERIANVTIAFAYLSKQGLRGDNLDTVRETVVKCLSEEEFKIISQLKARKVAYVLEVLRACVAEGFTRRIAESADARAGIALMYLPEKTRMDEYIELLSACLGTCNRIKLAPVPSIHTAFMRVFSLVYLVAMPFILAPEIGFGALIVQMIIAWVVYGVQAAADMLENPFGTDKCDLQLDVFCKSIRAQCEEVSRRRSAAAPYKIGWKLADGPSVGAPAAKDAESAVEFTFMSEHDLTAEMYAGRPRAETRGFGKDAQLAIENTLLRRESLAGRNHPLGSQHRGRALSFALPPGQLRTSIARRTPKRNTLLGTIKSGKDSGSELSVLSRNANGKKA